MRGISKTAEPFNRLKKGAVRTINMKEGEKIATVATTAPRRRCVRYPTNAAVMTMGPGVTWPRAMPSMNVFASIQPLT